MQLSGIAGHLSPRALGLVMEWAVLRQKELSELWDKAASQQALYKLDPLP